MPGVEGLVHVTELSWTKRVAKPSDVLKPEQEIEAVVLGINREEQKIRRFRSVSASSKSIPGSAPARSTRPAARSKARFATSPATALSSSWKIVSMA
jgi:hypothetical protein